MAVSHRNTGSTGNALGLGPRLAAAEKLSAVLGGQAFVPVSVSEIADARDRALANRLVTTALRRHGHLNVIIKDLLDRGMPKKSGSFEVVLRIGLTELLFMPGQSEHSALFLAVEALKKDPKGRHLNKLLNGVLRSAQRQATVFSAMEDDDLLPEWLNRRWLKAYGMDAVAQFHEALLSGAPLDLTLKQNDDALVTELGGERLIGDSVRLMDRDKKVVDLPGYAEGQFWVQDAASALPARLMGLPKGARVLDLCAAPGGKTAQLIKAGYQVTALDNDAKRLERLQSNLERLHYQAELATADATDYSPKKLFDGILLDAPCSATGTFRRHPEVIWHRVQGDLSGRSKLQHAMLKNAIKCLKPGGILIYCTCSLEPEEGEAHAKWLAGSGGSMIPLPIKAAEVDGFDAALTPEGWLRTHPGMLVPGASAGGLDGFFVARFQRN